MWRPAIGLRALRQHWAMSTCVEQCCRTVDSLARAGHLVRYAQNWAHGCSGENLAVHGRRWTVRAGPGCTMRLPQRTRHRRTTPRSMAAPDARKGCGARVVTGWLRGRNEVVTGRQTREASSEIRAGPFCLSMRSLPVLLVSDTSCGARERCQQYTEATRGTPLHWRTRTDTSPGRAARMCSSIDDCGLHGPWKAA